MAKTLLPVAAMERILKKSGAERVSDNAKEALKEVLEEYGDKIGKKAILYFQTFAVTFYFFALVK